MKNKTKLLTVTMAIAILLSSCTMQKRLYTHGYYIESNVGMNSPLKTEPYKKTGKIESAQKNEEPRDASATPKKSIGIASILKNETGKIKKQISPTVVLPNTKSTSIQIVNKAIPRNNRDNDIATNTTTLSATLEASGDASKNWAAILGFILAFFFPLLGLIFSIIGLPSEHHGLALAGIIISSILILIIILVVAKV